MYDVMEGVRVIEVAEHTFVPAAAMILADWGADVIKVERASNGGDAFRSLRATLRPDLKANPYFEAANRGKRAIALELTQPEGREQLYKLVSTADVFITNMRDGARAKMGIEPDDLFAINPRLIYARGSGYGRRGPMSQHGGFDFPSSWCRSGSAYVQTPANGDPPPSQPGSIGDLGGGATLAGAIAAALFRRERTGKGTIVDHALYMVGTYLMSQSLIAASLSGQTTTPAPVARHRSEAGDPLSNSYRTKDGRWLVLCFLYEAWWPDLARTLGRPEWIDDPRFVDVPARAANNTVLIKELDAIFATRTLAEWETALFDLEGVWAPMKSPAEVIEDAQALENGFVTPVTMPDDTQYLAGASPCQFDERPIGRLTASPSHGEHTEDVMRELGLTEEQIAGLRGRGVIA